MKYVLCRIYKTSNYFIFIFVPNITSVRCQYPYLLLGQTATLCFRQSVSCLAAELQWLVLVYVMVLVEQLVLYGLRQVPSCLRLVVSATSATGLSLVLVAPALLLKSLQVIWIDLILYTSQMFTIKSIQERAPQKVYLSIVIWFS